MSRQAINKAERRQAWKLAGVCYCCGRPRWKEYAMCIEHLEQNRIYSRDRKRRMKAAELAKVTP